MKRGQAAGNRGLVRFDFSKGNLGGCDKFACVDILISSAIHFNFYTFSNILLPSVSL